MFVPFPKCYRWRANHLWRLSSTSPTYLLPTTFFCTRKSIQKNLSLKGNVLQDAHTHTPIASWNYTKSTSIASRRLMTSMCLCTNVLAFVPSRLLLLLSQKKSCLKYHSLSEMTRPPSLQRDDLPDNRYKRFPHSPVVCNKRFCRGGYC